jgi:DNA-binding NtrC family response regulator
MMSRSVLIVEDDLAAARYAAAALREDFHDLRTVSCGTEALLAMESKVPDAIVLDLGLPDIDGLELLAMLRERWPESPVILVTAAQDVATVFESVRRGATNYLVKPVAPAMLRAALQKALTTFSVRRSGAGEGIPEIVGASRKMVEVRHLAVLAARTDANVLITGDTGTGKEMVARAIHRISSLSRGPFVPHNCSLTPPGLFESQFFGHRRGAFTSADRDHVGLLEEAHGGILFLDELECLSSMHQAKLLRVLDDGEVRPIGSSGVRTVSVRFLAASNRDPRDMVGDGRLREDLYYRLRSIEIRLPPLRERPEDIPLLARHFLGEGGGSFTPEALEALCGHAWPGNVRELRNVVRHARAVSPDRPIAPRDLGLRDRRTGMSDGRPGIQTLEAAELRAIEAALRESGGNRSLAARALGIDRSTLRRKARRLHHA